MKKVTQKTKWEGLFEELLDMYDFDLIYHTKSKDWSVKDRTGVNLADIEDGRDKSALSLSASLEIYFHDYIIEDLEQEVRAYQLLLLDAKVLEKRHGINTSDSVGYWLAYKQECLADEIKGVKFVDDHQFSFDCCELIAYHLEEIDLQHVRHITIND